MIYPPQPQPDPDGNPQSSEPPAAPPPPAGDPSYGDELEPGELDQAQEDDEGLGEDDETGTSSPGAETFEQHPDFAEPTPSEDLEPDETSTLVAVHYWRGEGLQPRLEGGGLFRVGPQPILLPPAPPGAKIASLTVRPTSVHPMGWLRYEFATPACKTRQADLNSPLLGASRTLMVEEGWRLSLLEAA